MEYLVVGFHGHGKKTLMVKVFFKILENSTMICQNKIINSFFKFF